MELRYNLTQSDYLRGLLLHERRLRGAGSLLRCLARAVFLVSAGFSALTLSMLALIFFADSWESNFPRLTGLVAASLLLSVAMLWLLSPRRRARLDLRRQIGSEDFFGAHLLTLTHTGVVLRFGENCQELAYPDITQVWEKKGYCCLYCKRGLWYALPPCAFSGPDQREDFLKSLRTALAGERPEETAAEPPSLPDADLTFTYAWTPEKLVEGLTSANLRYARIGLFWRPARVVSMLLGMGLVLLGGISMASGYQSGLGVLLLGAALGLTPLLLLFPPMVRWLVTNQLHRGTYHGLLDGPQTVLFWDGGLMELHGGGRDTARWEQVAAVSSTADGLCLFRRDNKLHVFPPRAFPDGGEQEHAAAYVRAHMDQ